MEKSPLIVSPRCVFRLLHDVAGHAGNFFHELVALELSLLDLAQLEFPVAGQFRRGEFGHLQSAQQA